MHILGITTPLLRAGDDLASILRASCDMHNGDILVISSKAIATCEGAAIDLARIKPTDEAMKLSKECHLDPLFTQAVLNETDRLNGAVVGACPFALLTSLKPNGMKTGRILCPNAGLDQSNVQEGCAIGWPKDPVVSAQRLRMTLENLMEGDRRDRSLRGNRSSRLTSVPSVTHVPSVTFRIAVIISDSCCRPARLGVTAFALVCCGIDPMQSEVGKTDLFGKQLRVTQEAVADQLATAANAVMGNAAQSTPAAIIRDHCIPLSDFCGWVEGIEPEEDLFRNCCR